MILTQGLAVVVEDVHDDMINGQAGTATTLFLKTQDGLINPVAASNLTLSNKTFTVSQVTANHVIGTGTANSNTITEYEVNNGTISFNRTVRAGVSKTSTIEITAIHTFDFELIL